jgi:hypothetical protein
MPRNRSPLPLRGPASLRGGPVALRGPTPLRDASPEAPPEEDAGPVAVEQALERVQTAFQERAKDEEQRFRDATDSEYWVAITFQSRAQKEEFLRALGLLELGDKYLDGEVVAAQLGLELKSPRPKWPTKAKTSSRLRGLT